jgi:CHASE2 domain-containing sensor protein
MYLKQRELFGLPLTLVFGIPLFIFSLYVLRIFDFNEPAAIDLRFKIRGEQKASPEITLVTIDDPSLAAVGEWPWPRSVHALLLSLISKFQPRSVFFDILFMESSPKGGEDEQLRDAIQDAGNVILPFFHFSDSSGMASFPIPELKNSALGIGYSNVDPDPDGCIRRIQFFKKTNGETTYSIPALMWSFDIQDKNAGWLDQLPLDSKHNLLINYPGSMASFNTISVSEVIDAAGTEREEKLRKLFQDRFVLIGHIATGTSDLIETPFSVASTGVVVHASVLHTLLSNRYLRLLPEPLHFLILLIFSSATLWISNKLTPFKSLLIIIAAICIYAVINTLLFIWTGWIIPLFVPIAVMMLAYGFAIFVRYMDMRFQRELTEQELRTAAEIQQSFLPQTSPESPYFDVAFECQFTKQVGGDFFDWVDLKNERHGFCVGDVSGKGVPAAIYMARALNDFRRMEKQLLSAGQVCEALNNVLVSQATPGMFLTLIYVVVDPKHQKLFFSSAGHEPMIFYENKTKTAKILKGAQGTPLGMFENTLYETVETSFDIGDSFLLLSDGVRELRNPKGEELGLEKLAAQFESVAKDKLTPKQLIDLLFKNMLNHQKGTPAHDDRTLLSLQLLKK